MIAGNQDDCVFPFEYHGKTYNSCTDANHNGPRCAWDSNYQSGRWSNCGKERTYSKANHFIFEIKNYFEFKPTDEMSLVVLNI